MLNNDLVCALDMRIRTSMILPKELLDEAVKLSGAGTQTTAVILGLEELIRRKRLETLLTHKGKGYLGLTQRDLKRMRRG